MTPQEKAEELIGSHERFAYCSDNYSHEDRLDRATGSAIITCDQVMSAVIKNGHEYNFWKEVKEILEK